MICVFLLPEEKSEFAKQHEEASPILACVSNIRDQVGHWPVSQALFPTLESELAHVGRPLDLACVDGKTFLLCTTPRTAGNQREKLL